MKTVISIFAVIFFVMSAFEWNAAAEEIFHDGPIYVGYGQPDEVMEIGADTIFHQNGDIAVGGNGTLLINGGTLRLNGHLYIAGNASAIVDGGNFHIEGHYTNIYVIENGRFQVFNNALLHYVQFYTSQHYIIAWGNGHVQIHNSTVDCDGSVEFIHLKEHASYEAIDVEYRHWKTWYLWDDASLNLENISLAGDIVFYDRPTMSFKNTDVIMPWLYFGDGAVVNIEFPRPDTPWDPITMTLDNNLPGVSGIPWTLSIDNCRGIAWGVNPYPGSDVTISNSDLTMVLYRFKGEGIHRLDGIMVADSFYEDLIFPERPHYIEELWVKRAKPPTPDRYFRLKDTRVNWWKVDVCDTAELHGNGIVFSEMVVRDESRTFLTDSVCEGQTIHLGAIDDAFIHFDNGEVWTYISVWQNAVMVLSDSLVDWMKGYEDHGFIYQTENIAHGDSRLYCLNTFFREQPEAFDSAVVMTAFIDPLDYAKTDETIAVTGSAWIETGPGSAVEFDRYELAWSSSDSAEWTLIHQSQSPIYEGVLGNWDTSGMPQGDYRLRLSIIATNDSHEYPVSDYPAYRTVFVSLKRPLIPMALPTLR